MRLLPLALLGVLAVVELAANWRVGRMVSISEQVWSLEERFGWWARAALVLAFALLAGHLFARWPYGPR